MITARCRDARGPGAAERGGRVHAAGGAGYVTDDRLDAYADRYQMNGPKHYLFACGDFQEAAVQDRIFGRRLAGQRDALPGFCREPFVRPSGVSSDRVDGTVFELTDADLAAADASEPPNYRRSKVKTASGLLAWVYLRQDGQSAAIP